MVRDTPRKIIARLEKLLEEERQSLLAGNLKASAALVETKEALVETLNTLPPAALPQLQGVHAKMARNQVLLDGTLEGIRRVAHRVGTIRRTRNVLETYDNTGQRTAITTQAKRKLEKRA